MGVGLTYSVIAGFFNRTELYVSAGNLRVRHGPVPWLGNRALPTREIEQVFGREDGRSRNASATFSVHVQRRGGAQLRLLSGLESIDQALFIEQQIETRLGIRDRPVAGELPRG